LNLREKERVKIIIVSGNCSASEMQVCLDKEGEIRADDFLKKPLGFDGFK
jgi:hypothetical protein